MNAAIVDDSAEDIELLCSYLSRYSREHNVYMHVEKFPLGPEGRERKRNERDF